MTSNAGSDADLCAKCGFERREHSYNGACYGLCGEFIARAPDPEEVEKRRILTMLGYNPDDPDLSVQLITETVTSEPPEDTKLVALLEEVFGLVKLWDESPPPASLAETEECIDLLLHNLHDTAHEQRSVLLSIASVAIWHVRNLIDRG